MAAMTKQQILDVLKRSGWSVVGEREDTAPGDVTTTNEFGDPDTTRGQVPTGNKVWSLIGPNGEPDEITVTPNAAVESGGQWSTEPMFTIAKGPTRAPSVSSSGSSNPAKGTRRIRESGGRWLQEVAVDDKGTWSIDTDEQGKPIYADITKPDTTKPDTSPTTKTVNGVSYQYNAATNTWDQAQGLPAEAPKPGVPTTKTVNGITYQWNADTSTWDRSNLPTESPTSTLTPGEAAKDTATASTAQATADAALAKAQADAKTAEVQYQDALRLARQAPTDEQKQQALATAQRGLDLANQNLEQSIKQAGNLNPIAVQQAQATLEQTRQNTQKAQQGDLYGRREQLQQIRDLIASGDIKPEQGDQMAAAINAGTTPFDALKQQQSDRNTARATSGTNLNQLASSFQSMATNAFTQISDLNKYATPGSSAGADAFVAMLNMAQDRLGQYKLPAAQETNYLGPMVNAAQQQIAQPAVAAAPAPPPATSSAQPVTINIGSGAASNPQPPTAVNPQAAGDPYANSASTHINSMVDQAKAQTKGTIGDVLSMGGPDFAKYLGLTRSSGPQVA